MEAGVARSGDAGERIVTGACCDVRGDLWCGCAARAGSAGAALVRGVLAGVACGPLDEVDRVPVLDLNCSEGVVVLQHAARVYQPLALGGDVCIVVGRELGLDIGDGGGGGEGQDMLLVVCGLDVEGDLWLVDGWGGVVGHGVSGEAVPGLRMPRERTGARWMRAAVEKLQVRAGGGDEGGREFVEACLLQGRAGDRRAGAGGGSLFGPCWKATEDARQTQARSVVTAAPGVMAVAVH